MTDYRGRSNILSSPSSSKENLERSVVSSAVPFISSSSANERPRQPTVSVRGRPPTSKPVNMEVQQQYRQASEDSSQCHQSTHQQQQLGSYNQGVIGSGAGYGRPDSSYASGYRFAGNPMTMGYGYGYGMMNPYAMGPLYFIQNINYFVMSIGHFFDLIGMSSHALLETLRSFIALLKQLEMKIRTSEFRRWLQRKSRKSRLLRFLFVIASTALSIQISKWMKVLILKYVATSLGWVTSPSSSSSIASSPSILDGNTVVASANPRSS